MDRRLNFGDWLGLSARRVPDKTAIVCHGAGGLRLSFAEMDHRVRRLAAGLEQLGLRQRDRIAIVATDCHRYAEAMFACFQLGITVMPINSRLAASEFANVMSVARPAALFLGKEYRAFVDVARSSVAIPLVIAFDGAGPGELDYESLLETPGAAPGRVVVDDEDPLILAFTSGTTGTPKAVMQPQRMLKNLTLQQLIELELGSDEYSYYGSPLFHMFGRSGLLCGIVRGYPSLLMPRFDAAQVLEYLVRDGLTHCAFVPTMLSMVIDEGAAQHQFPHLRRILYGAAPMSPGLLRQVLDIFRCDLINGFGAGTEVGAQTTLTAEDHRRAAAGATHLLESIGRPALGVDFRLVDDEMNDVPPGSVGEIATRSEWMMTGYLDMDAETNAKFRDGWFCAGDMARMDSDGYVYLAGRRDDMIIRGGQNIYPIEIENVLSEAPGVGQVAVVGRSDAKWGQVVWAYVEGDAALVDVEQLRATCRARLAAYKVPEVIRVVGRLPVGSTGKIDKHEIQRWAEGLASLPGVGS